MGRPGRVPARARARGWSAPAWPVEIGGRGLGVEDQIACDAEFDHARPAAHRGVRRQERRARRSPPPARPSRRCTCSGSSAPTRSGARASASPTPGATSPACAAAPSCTTTTSSSTAPRSGPRSACGPPTACSSCAPIPTRPRTVGSRRCSCRSTRPGITRKPDRAGDRRARLRRAGLRGRRRAACLRCSARCTRGGASPCRRSATSAPVSSRSRATSSPRSNGSCTRRGRRRTPQRGRRDRGAAIYTRARILGWLGERSLLDDGGGPNGGVAGLIKLAWSTLGQSFAEYAADVDGLAAIAGDDMRSGRRLVGSRSLDHRRRHHRGDAQHHRRTLPRPPPRAEEVAQPAAAAYSSRSWRLESLPASVRGNEARNSTRRGHL